MNKYPKGLDGEPPYGYASRCSHRSDGRSSPWPAAAGPAYAWSWPLRSGTPWNAGNERPPARPDGGAGGQSCSAWRLGPHTPAGPRPLVSNAPAYGHGPDGFWPRGWRASRTPPAAGPTGGFPPAVAIPVVRLAGERPETRGRRRLAAHPLKPWRHPRWRDAKHPRDAACYGTVSDLSELYPLGCPLIV
jgi:hypothetical protein